MNDDILIVDDDPASIQLLGSILSEVGTLRFATGGKDALRLAHESPPDLILLDAEMPGMSGFQVCEALKSEPAYANVPVIFVSSHNTTAYEVSGFNVGASDFIIKPVSAPLVLARVKTQLRVKHLTDALRRMATTDALTGIANRRFFDEVLEQECRRARRSDDPIALLMLDVDHFKSFNDRYGHLAGDSCLRVVAHALASVSLRPADVVARYGGEEFVVLLPQTPRGGAEHVALEILAEVKALNIAHDESLTAPNVTVSLGVACYDSRSACWGARPADTPVSNDAISCRRAADLVKAADRALYAAKRAGRAQARLLDVADVDSPDRARDLMPTASRSGR